MIRTAANLPNVAIPASPTRKFMGPRTAATATIATALAFVQLPTAQADEVGYLQYLTAHGFVVYDTAAMLNTGYLACDMMNTNTGDVVATQILYRFPSEATVDSAVTVVIAAAQELCPWHWHPSAPPPPPPPPPLLRAS